mmetsp:Transcript_11653/g.34350  ORF Transcript_11653/g.34350 Transcript_11653/m.34350 type:complete len:215 (-) Transcript_11653:120-764(-)
MSSARASSAASTPLSSSGHISEGVPCRIMCTRAPTGSPDAASSRYGCSSPATLALRTVLKHAAASTTMPPFSCASRSANNFPPDSLFFFFSAASKSKVARGGSGVAAPSSSSGCDSGAASRKARAQDSAAWTTSALSPFFVFLKTHCCNNGTKHSPFAKNAASSRQRSIASIFGSGFLPLRALASLRESCLNCLAASLACWASVSSGGASAMAA